MEEDVSKKAKKPITRMAIVLDRSGSMAATAAQAVSGLNEQVQQARELAKDHDLRCSLVTFNGEVFEHLWDCPASDLREAAPEDFKPNGSTAMLDALGYTVQKLLTTAPTNDDEIAYLIFLISDGETNADMHYAPASIKELVGACQATKRWTFTYMGCSQADLDRVSSYTGMAAANMGTWSNATATGSVTAHSNRTMRSAKYFAERLVGQTASQQFYGGVKEEKTSAGIVVACADLSEPQPELAPAPVIETAVHVDMANILAKQPKYQNVCTASGGTGIFGSTNAVVWK
jgi:uncharacterized protein YegL